MVSGESKELAELFVGFLSSLFVFVSGWFMWEKKRSRDTLDNHSVRIAKIESEMMTEEKTKDLISEHLDPLKEDMAEVKEDVRTMALDVVQIRIMLAESRGYHQAKDNLRGTRPADKPDIL